MTEILIHLLQAKEGRTFLLVVLEAVLIGIFFYFKPKSTTSHFRTESFLNPKIGPKDLIVDPPVDLVSKFQSQMPHEVLGILPTASPSEIKKAYRNLIKQYHPDRALKAGLTAEHDRLITIALTEAKEKMLEQ